MSDKEEQKVTAKYRAARHGLRRSGVLAILAVVSMLTALVLSSGIARLSGSQRLISIQPLPSMDGEQCQWEPASAAGSLVGRLQQAPGDTAATAAPGAEPRPAEAARADLRQRRPLRAIEDKYPGYAGIAVDPVRNEVVMTDENDFSVLVYDRTENTPPTAAMSEPKRIIKGSEYLEYACGTYIDPATGDIYVVNNDTVDWLVIFDRNAKGAVDPTRKLATPHTTFGVAVDEENQEMFLTIQDDHAVVVYNKKAKEDDSPLRIIQGAQTQMADPHGIALDSKTGMIFVSNWGSTSERPAPGAVPGGGRGGEGTRPDFPVGSSRAFPGSGKTLPPSITVYRKDAKGDVAPVRVIRGTKTQLDWPTALAVDPERGELFVANDTGDSVAVFRIGAEGDVAPIRVIKGPRTLLKNPIGLSVDVKNNELFVANFGNHSATVFPIAADGDVPPVRVIRGAPAGVPAPMYSNPHVVRFDSKRKEILVAN